MLKKLKKMLSGMSFRLRTVLSFLFVVVFPLLLFVFYCLFPGSSVPVYIYGVSIFVGAAGWWFLNDVVSDVKHIVQRAKREWKDLLGKESGVINDAEFLYKAFEKMTKRVRSGVEELGEISRTSEQLNQDVGANVTLLSAVIKLNEMMIMQCEDSQLYEFIIHKLREILMVDIAFLLLDDHKNNRFSTEVLDSVRQLEFEGISKDEAFIHSVLVDKQMIIVDTANSYRSDFCDFFKKKLGLDNIFLVPVVINDEVLGFVGCGIFGARHTFSVKSIELIAFFIKYIVFNLRLNMSSVLVSDSEIKDALTGLYTETFMIDRLDEEMERSRRGRIPCGIYMIKLNRFKKYLVDSGILSVEADLKKIASVLLDDLAEGSKAVRCSEDVFCIICPGMNKPQIEELKQKAIRDLMESFGEKFTELGICGASAEMPIDGMTRQELLAHTEKELTAAQPTAARRADV